MLRGVTAFRQLQRLVRCVSCVAIGAAILIGSGLVARAASDTPLRGYWVPRASLNSLDSIRRAIASAQAAGFDTVFVPIALADAEASALFDGVRESIREARERGLRVQAWIDVNRIVSGDEFPASRTHVIYQHPEWLMVPRELASELMAMDPRGPAYLGRLSRWARANRPRVDGLYVTPLDPDAASYLTRLVSAAIQRYVVDGVYLDGLRFPGSDFDYSRRAMDLFRADTRTRLSPADRARVDAIEAIDPFGYTSEFPTEWAAFRESRLTALITRIHTALKALNPKVTITANAAVDGDSARAEQFQDWRSWIANRLIDGVGQRNGNSTTILLSGDAVVVTPTILPVGGQASAGTGGSR